MHSQSIATIICLNKRFHSLMDDLRAVIANGISGMSKS